MLAGCSSAEQAVRFAVQPGTTFTYATSTRLDIEQSTIGDVNLDSRVEATAVLYVAQMNEVDIDWRYTLMDAHVVTPDTEKPGRTVDTVMSGSPRPFTTNRSGNLLSMPKGSLEGGGGVSLLSAVEGEALQLIFPPQLPAGYKRGSTWRQSLSDSIVLLAGVQPIQRKQSFIYTFDGQVDTLGMSLTRIRLTADTMSMDGKLSMKGLDFTVQGNGGTNAVLYYAQDGLLYAGRYDKDMNLRLGISRTSKLTVPITQTISSTIVRK